MNNMADFVGDVPAIANSDGYQMQMMIESTSDTPIIEACARLRLQA
jgi:hypothetical protein